MELLSICPCIETVYLCSLDVVHMYVGCCTYVSVSCFTMNVRILCVQYVWLCTVCVAVYSM